MSKKGIFFSDLESPFLYIKEKANKKHTVNSKIVSVSRNYQPKSNYCFRQILLSFLSYQTRFARCPQCCRYNRQLMSTCSIFMKKKRYTYHINIFLCINVIFSAFYSLNKRKSMSTHIKVRGNNSKNYVKELFSPIVQGHPRRQWPNFICFFEVACDIV